MPRLGFLTPQFPQQITLGYMVDATSVLLIGKPKNRYGTEMVLQI